MPYSTALHALLADRPYLVGPLARLNNNLDRLPAELKQQLDDSGIHFPSRNMFHSIVARAVEMHVALSEALRLTEAYDPATAPHADAPPRAGTGFGCTEAPRGILWHRYELPEASARLSSHGLDLASTLALVEALGLFQAGIRIIGIEMPAEAGPDTPAPRLDEAQARRLHEAVLGWLDVG